MSQVRVTLLQPWVGSKDGSVKKRMGFEAAIRPDSGGTYANDAKPIPGAAIWMELHPDQFVLIPEEWAKLYFGDWTCIENEADTGPQFRIVRGPIGNMREKIPTKSDVKDEVARVWGDYRRASEKGMKQDHPEFPTGGAIGPPAMPHVLVESVGPDGMPDGKLQYDPWEFLGFNEEFADFEDETKGLKVIFDYAKVK
jgi:hypothetical protein